MEITQLRLREMGFKYFPTQNQVRAIMYMQSHTDMYVAVVFIQGKFSYASLRNNMSWHTGVDVIVGGVTNFDQLVQFLSLLTGRET